MNITYQNWSPDTCGCVVEEQWDKDASENGTSFSKVIKKCSAHSSVADNDLYGVLYSNPDGENKRKNRIRKFLVEDEGLDLGELKTLEDKSTVRNFKDGIEMEWSFTGTGASRELVILVTGTTLDITKKDAIKNYCDTEFGVGKVTVE